jgi:hypothetical protein
MTEPGLKHTDPTFRGVVVALTIIVVLTGMMELILGVCFCGASLSRPQFPTGSSPLARDSTGIIDGSAHFGQESGTFIRTGALRRRWGSRLPRAAADIGFGAKLEWRRAECNRAVSCFIGWMANSKNSPLVWKLTARKERGLL